MRKLQRNREIPEVTKSTKMKKKKGKLARKLTERDAKRIGVVKPPVNARNSQKRCHE